MVRISSDRLVRGWKELLVTSSNHAGGKTLLNVRLDCRASILKGGNNPRIGYAIPSPDGRFLAIEEETGTSNVLLVDNSKPDDRDEPM
jgi:hypothetical protein